MQRLIFWALRAIGSPAGWIAIGLSVLALGKLNGDVSLSGLVGPVLSTFNTLVGAAFSILKQFEMLDAMEWSDLEKSSLAVMTAAFLPFFFLQANSLYIWIAKLGALLILLLSFYLFGTMDLFTAQIGGDEMRLGPYVIAGGYAVLILVSALLGDTRSSKYHALTIRYGQNLLGAGILIGGLVVWDMVNFSA